MPVKQSAFIYKLLFYTTTEWFSQSVVRSCLGLYENLRQFIKSLQSFEGSRTRYADKSAASDWKHTAPECSGIRLRVLVHGAHLD